MKRENWLKEWNTCEPRALRDVWLMGYEASPGSGGADVNAAMLLKEMVGKEIAFEALDEAMAKFLVEHEQCFKDLAEEKKGDEKEESERRTILHSLRVLSLCCWNLHKPTPRFAKAIAISFWPHARCLCNEDLPLRDQERFSLFLSLGEIMARECRELKTLGE